MIIVSGLRGKEDGIVAMSMARWRSDLLTGLSFYGMSTAVVGLGLLLGLSFFRAPDGPGPVKTDSWAAR